MKKTKFLTSETLKDEYHESLERAMERLLITDKVKSLVRKARKFDDLNYIALAALAHEFGDHAFYLGLKIYMNEHNS